MYILQTKKKDLADMKMQEDESLNFFTDQKEKNKKINQSKSSFWLANGDRGFQKIED